MTLSRETAERLIAEALEDDESTWACSMCDGSRHPIGMAHSTAVISGNIYTPNHERALAEQLRAALDEVSDLTNKLRVSNEIAACARCQEQCNHSVSDPELQP